MARFAVLLMGPTGAGKSDLALDLIEHLPLEIVSVDSAMIYRGMDIGTAKPATDILARVPHHLVNILDPAQRYSAGEFLRDARAAMDDIWARGRHPLLVGGTMMYFHALTEGMAELPRGDAAIRTTIEEEAGTQGWAVLHAELARVDPQAARRIHANDPQRIQRALEVYRITGEPISALQRRQVAELAGVEVIEFALAPSDRSALHRRIAQRFESMLQQGFVEEVSTLYERGDLSPVHPSIRCVGYRQLWRHVTGECSLASAKEAGIVATRQLAKRQWTWLRRRAAAHWLDSMHPEVASMLRTALSQRMSNS